MSHGPVAEAFYAGRYAEVLNRTIDAPAFDFTADDAAFVVGALAFTGRLEEARAVLASQGRKEGSAADLRRVVASRFFLGVAESRAGRHDVAERAYRENLRGAGASNDPVCRFYVAQGLACMRYFSGLVVRAARHVKRSLRYAIEARFQYGRLLATDLRGHALVQMGRVHAGLVLLEQARDLARSLGLSGNAAAIECALAAYRARFGAAPIARAVEELSALARTTPVGDSYSRRAIELELAEQLAQAGRGDEAWARLEALSAAPIPDGDARARVRFLVACASVARLRYGRTEARTYAMEARAALSSTSDRALAADVLSVELMLAEDADRAALLRRLRELHAATGISRARVVAAAVGGEDEADALKVAEFEEDRSGARLFGVHRLGLGSVERLLGDGHLGLVPLAAGVAGKAALVEVSPEKLVVAERGNVRVADDVPAGAMRLLHELASGEGDARAWRSKEQLVGVVWGLSRYRPDRHDAIVHTAVSRLRGLLGTAGHWIEGRDGAYRLAANVAFRGRGATLGTSSPPVESAPSEPGVEGDATARERALLAHVARAGGCSTAEAASAMKVSEMTAFRTLRALCDRGLLSRTGKGRGTRYIAGRHEARRGR